MGVQGGVGMELAKVTSKGQITIPVEIRRKLGIKDGDKVLFLEDGSRIYMMNSSMDALREISEVGENYVGHVCADINC